MGIKERKEREINERRALILNAASEILIDEGMDNLSIRKIANKIEYSPSIIYHYFRDKEDIMEQLLSKGYQKIVTNLISIKDTIDTPEEKIKAFTRNYIYSALENSEEYKYFLLNDTPRVLEHTSVLFKGVSLERESMKILCQALREIDAYKCADDEQIELTGQVIWTSTFGLIIRMMIEKNLTQAQTHNLIEHHIALVMNGMIPAGLQKKYKLQNERS